jgi:membrane protease YdiL (CAAX protease family)
VSRAGDIENAPLPRPAAVPAKGRAGYFEHSRTPLVSLAFVLPLIVIYELATVPGAAEGPGNTPQHIIAFTLLEQFFSLFGATGRHLPAMAVAGILIAWHIARHDPWKVRLTALGGMAAEGTLLSIPLIGLGVALAHLFRALPLAASAAPGVVSAVPSRNLLVLCLGAGIYEEMVFRLIILTVLSLVVKDLLLFPAKASGLTVVLVSAVLFSAYHYLGDESFHWHTIAGWRTFAFRTLAGIYFGVLFLTRGFGVTAATHAAYDILVLLALP